MTLPSAVSPPTCRSVALLALLLFTTSAAHGAVVAQPPGQAVTVLSEQALVVFDPLDGTQTIVLQHLFEGTSTPFGLLIPTPAPPRISLHGERLRRAIHNKLHPRGKVQRTLDLQIVSWVGGCAVRQVGDGPLTAEDEKRKPRSARAKPSSLGSAPEPLHDWLLGNGFTLGPAQAAWLARLRALGWTVTGVVVKPPAGDGTPPPVLRGPVIALTHAADAPMLAAAHPPFALDESPDSVPLEVAVLSEWAAALDVTDPPEPFYAHTIAARALSRMSSEAGGLPWAFRRNGTLTAWSVSRPTGLGILRFNRTEPRQSVRPTPTPRIRAHRLHVPIELLLLAAAAVFWIWLRFGRRRSTRHHRL